MGRPYTFLPKHPMPSGETSSKKGAGLAPWGAGWPFRSINARPSGTSGLDQSLSVTTRSRPQAPISYPRCQIPTGQATADGPTSAGRRPEPEIGLYRQTVNMSTCFQSQLDVTELRSRFDPLLQPQHSVKGDRWMLSSCRCLQVRNPPNRRPRACPDRTRRIG